MYAADNCHDQCNDGLTLEGIRHFHHATKIPFKSKAYIQVIYIDWNKIYLEGVCKGTDCKVGGKFVSG